MRIDVHAHYYPKTYIDLLIALGRTDINPRSAHDADFADRIARMDEAGIDRQILSAIGLDTLLHERSAAAEAARCVNDAYAAQITRYPGRFGAFGWMPLPYVDEAIVEAARCLDDLDFDGVALACAYQGRCLDDEAFEPFWAMLNARAAVAYIHPVGRHSCGHFGMDRYTLDILIGSPSQEAVAASRLVYSQVTTRYPDIRFVLAGCGGVTPLLWEVHENLLAASFRPGMSLQAWAREAGIEAADPMAKFREFYIDSAAQGSDQLLHAAIAKFGPDKLLLGTDSPHGSEVRAVAHVAGCAALTAEQRIQVLDRNAAALLRRGRPMLEPPPTGAIGK
jgi:predicted TIM-barrel fold metal-dependent hydrolase